MLAKRPHRALELFLLLSRHEGLSLSQIALRLDCSHRTAAEDLELLRDSGIEVIRTAAGYRVAEPDGWQARLAPPPGGTGGLASRVIAATRAC